MMKLPLVVFLLLMSCFYQPSWSRKTCIFCLGNRKDMTCYDDPPNRGCFHATGNQRIPCPTSPPDCCVVPYAFRQSLLDKYCNGLDGAAIRPSTALIASTPQTNSTTVPIASTSRDECKSPTETCDWYRNCLQSQFSQCQGSENYALSVGERYCRRYGERYWKFSDKGKRWIDSVHTCLQEKLTKKLSEDPSLSCSELKTFAFDTHAPCYTNPGGGDSVCQLSCRDIFQMFRTTKGSLVSREFWRVYQSASEVSSSCKFKNSSFGFNVCFFGTKTLVETAIGGAVLRTVKPLFRLIKFAVPYVTRGKRSVDCDNQFFAEKIVEEFIAKLSSRLNHTLERFVFSNNSDSMLNVELVLSNASLLNPASDANYKLSVRQFSLITQDLLTEMAETKELMVDGQLVTINDVTSCDDANCEKAWPVLFTISAAKKEHFGVVLFVCLFVLSYFGF